MVEMGGNQATVGIANQQAQHPSVPDTALNLDATFCFDNNQWLTVDISTLEQDVNSLYNSVFGSNGNETNSSQVETGNVNLLSNSDGSQRCLTPVSPKGKKLDTAEVPQTVESDIWGLELDDPICQNKGSDSNLDLYYETRSPLSFWGAPMDLDVLKMDDVFQVDKADLVQGPTLAELNANDESLFNSLDYYDTLLPNGKKLQQLTQSCRNTTTNIPNTVKSKASNTATPLHQVITPIVTSTAIPITVQNDVESVNKSLSSNIPVTSQPLQCASLLQKNHLSTPKTHTISSAKTFDADSTKYRIVHRNDSVDGSSVIPQLSSSAPATTGFLQNWQETSLQKQLPTVIGNHRTRRDTDRSICSFSSMSSLSNDEDVNSDREDDDNDGDCVSSDNESLPGGELNKKSPTWALTFRHRLTKNKKKKRFFWQYNIQSKGPKGPRVSLSSESLDPHVLSNATDPVFSSNCQLDGVKHAGKARRGDGNDLTPNPRKLYNIGAELKKLSKIINDLTPVSELPFNSRSKSRKEKNKLASRACRLKKKAQHEANKLKLYGLQQEHKILLTLLEDLREIVKGKIDPDSFPCNRLLPDNLDTFIQKEDPEMVAGQASEFVNKVLDKVAFGDPNGGLAEL